MVEIDLETPFYRKRTDQYCGVGGSGSDFALAPPPTPLPPTAALTSNAAEAGIFGLLSSAFARKSPVGGRRSGVDAGPGGRLSTRTCFRGTSPRHHRHHHTHTQVCQARNSGTRAERFHRRGAPCTALTCHVLVAHAAGSGVG